MCEKCILEFLFENYYVFKSHSLTIPYISSNNRLTIIKMFSQFCFRFKVSNFVVEDDIIHGHPEVNDEGYFYEDIPEDEGFVSEGPWTSSPDEYSSHDPVTGHQDAAVDNSGVCQEIVISPQTCDETQIICDTQH